MRTENGRERRENAATPPRTPPATPSREKKTARATVRTGQKKPDPSKPYYLTPSEIESLRQDQREAIAYGHSRWAHLRPKK